MVLEIVLGATLLSAALPAVGLIPLVPLAIPAVGLIPLPIFF